MAEITPQHDARELGKRASQFDAGRPAAHHDNRHQRLDRGRIALRFRSLEGQQHFAPDAQGVLERLQSGREFRPFRMPEVAGGSTERDHEVIILQPMVGEHDLARGKVEVAHLVHQHGHVRFVRENGADGLGDFRGGKPCRGDLVEQRLKEVMIRAIHQRHARGGMMKFLAEGQSSEPRPEHHDVRLFALRHRHSMMRAVPSTSRCAGGNALKHGSSDSFRSAKEERSGGNMVEPTGIEPATFSLRTRRSTN